MGARFDPERFAERLDDFSRAVDRLEEAMDRPEDEFVRDAIIQRFEFSYELAWKTMRDWLAAKEIDVRNPRDTLIAAVEQGLIDDGNAWSSLQKERNLTTHTYDQEKADEVVAFLRSRGLDLLKGARERLIQWRPTK